MVMLNRYTYPIFVIFASSWLIRVNEASNILCMFTSSGKSQLMVFMAVASTLIERDHNVTIVTTIPIPPKSMSAKPFRHIFLEQNKETVMKFNEHLSELNEDVSKVRLMMNYVHIVNMFPTMQRDALMQAKFQEFLREDNQFDLMLMGYFNNAFLVGVAAHYRCPIAVISLWSPHGALSRMIGNPDETTYVQLPLFGKNQPMSFLERLNNFIWAVLEPLLSVYESWMMEEFYKSLFHTDFYPSYSDVISNISLVLCNHYFSELPIRPLVPAVVEIGGIEAKQHPDPLPNDIHGFLDASINGTIVYNVGAIARRTFLKPKQLNIVLNVLSKLDQSVLWEWEEGEPPSNISNILFWENLPIEDILFHQNVKLIISDGRLSDINGARYTGVPMVGMPISGDEPYYVEEMINKGYGLSIDVDTMTEDGLKDVINKVLRTTSYKDQVMRFARVYRDRPMTARQTAAFWLEYVIRHQGAPHMKSPLVHMDVFQRWNIDVIAVLWGGFYVSKKLIKLTVAIVRFCLDFREVLHRRRAKYMGL